MYFLFPPEFFASYIGSAGSFFILAAYHKLALFRQCYDSPQKVLYKYRKKRHCKPLCNTTVNGFICPAKHILPQNSIAQLRKRVVTIEMASAQKLRQMQCFLVIRKCTEKAENNLTGDYYVIHPTPHRRYLSLNGKTRKQKSTHQLNLSHHSPESSAIIRMITMLSTCL